MAVVYIPHGVSNAAKEALFQATFPADWIKMQRPETILTALSQALGGPPRPSLAVFSGDGKVLFNEDASMLVYQVSKTRLPSSKPNPNSPNPNPNSILSQNPTYT